VRDKRITTTRFALHSYIKIRFDTANIRVMLLHQSLSPNWQHQPLLKSQWRRSPHDNTGSDQNALCKSRA
jgi:hypothetical protein